jgi:cellulose biosynthesis protein BcsQ
MIVTFYSFKGGTGRTMSLANIAILLAMAGRRVLAVDFDLEAPGLWRFFREFEGDTSRRPGLLDMLRVQSLNPETSAIDWRDYVIPVSFERGSLDLMTSGKVDEGYFTRVLEFDWQSFFENSNGGAFIENLRTDWSREYDFVLVDSRTGITDTGGVCTIALPDLIVPMFVANYQNVDGNLEVLRRAQKGRQALAYDRPPALVLPVLSRFDMRTEYESADEWLDLLAERLRHVYADWLPNTIAPRKMLERTKLPYVAYFSFGEKLPVLQQGISDPESLGYALNSVARLIEGHLGNAATVAGNGAAVAAPTRDELGEARQAHNERTGVLVARSPDEYVRDIWRPDRAPSPATAGAVEPLRRGQRHPQDLSPDLSDTDPDLDLSPDLSGPDADLDLSPNSADSAVASLDWTLRGLPEVALTHADQHDGRTPLRMDDSYSQPGAIPVRYDDDDL